MRAWITADQREMPTPKDRLRPGARTTRRRKTPWRSMTLLRLSDNVCGSTRMFTMWRVGFS